MNDQLPLSTPLWFLCALPDEGTFRALFALFAEEVSLDEDSDEFARYFEQGSIETLRAFARARWHGSNGGLIGEIEEIGATADGWWLLCGFRLADRGDRAIITALSEQVQSEGGRFYLSASRPSF